MPDDVFGCRVADPYTHGRAGAEALAVSRRAVYALLHEGALAPVRVGRALRIDEAELRRFVDSGGRESLGGRKRAHA